MIALIFALQVPMYLFPFTLQALPLFKTRRRSPRCLGSCWWPSRGFLSGFGCVLFRLPVS